MTRPVALYADVVDTDPAPAVALLNEAGFDVRIAASDDPDVLVRTAPDAEALLIGYCRVDSQLVDRLPKLRLVATQSVGVDMVDLETCAARGIWVSNVPGAATEEVAAHAFAMTMALLRGLPFLDRDVRAGMWDGTRQVLRRPSEVTVGVLGLGRIGRRYVEYVRPVVGRVVGYDPWAQAPDGVEMLGLEEVLGASDVVSLHMPLTADARHLLDARRLALLPPGAAVVNVSRGALIDPVALAGYLDSGRLSAAALDVLAQEPPGEQEPLHRHPRVLVTPHAAYLSGASARDYVLHQARNAVALWQHGRPEAPVIAPTSPR